ncbi:MULTISPECIES: ABC transporter permease [unclassified Aerococcus]|uniref:ABC transporter permease n=1 Tax=unclassified Aerococcus TaxID=2618060 RepID=UPI0008A43884|nr:MULTISPECIES: ABC transporter permease [unclassified Aerococcus]MDK6369934.1 ABC transporter permease [Aerococcus sp. UMB9870]MDK6680592.1 ABC transporter permease [Aerococcus sp. UMB8608]MDK6687319.1 ABC transporter permease [Aerococcus sp. UMB8623]OFR30751.1 hypothetical protein HMPREF2892_09735 [Aerococcus sp. HMSC061A03]OFT40433.1 hypothetical protein HMPREF3161_05675 [Aerococcus sp. HMSC06H08]
MKALFNKRQEKEFQDFLYYSRYIFNDHFVIALMFLVGALSLNYSRWVQALQGRQVIADGLLIVAFSLMTWLGGVRTYLKEADIQFLLALETEWKAYFKAAFRSSLLKQSFLAPLACFLAWPYLKWGLNWTGWELLALALSFILLKATGLMADMEAYQGRSGQPAWLHLVLILLVYGLAFAYQAVWGLALAGGYALWQAFHSTWGDRWDWQTLLGDEGQAKQSLTSFLSLFVDLKAGKKQTKRRAYLDALTLSLDKAPSAHAYLYSRSFWRSTDLFPIWRRLTLVSLLLAFTLPKHGLTLVVFLLLNYASHFQLLPLAKAKEGQTMLKLYPESDDQGLRAFQGLLGQVYTFQVLVLSLALCLAGFGIWALVYLLTALVFEFLFIRYYLPRRLQKKKRARSAGRKKQKI